MSDYDFSGLTNPNRVIEKRIDWEEKAIQGVAPPAPASNIRFEKPRSAEEKARIQAALAKKLRETGR